MLEFAFVAPPFILILLGTFDIGHQMYATSVLQGTLQQSARQATLEAGFSEQNQIDSRIKDAVKTVMPGAEVTITRTNFQKFSDIVTPEEFTDGNGDNICNNGEPFEDLNNNSRWDRNRGSNGIGGANDAVLFEAKVNYERLFKVAGLIGVPNEVELTAQTVLRNQPFDRQAARPPTTRNCT